MTRPVGVLIVVMLVLAVPALAQLRATNVDDTQLYEVASHLRCVVCQNLSVADSPSATLTIPTVSSRSARHTSQYFGAATECVPTGHESAANARTMKTTRTASAENIPQNSPCGSSHAGDFRPVPGAVGWPAVAKQ